MRPRGVTPLLLLVAACSGGGDPAVTTAPPSGSADPVSVALAERLGPSGELDLALALDVFEAAFGVDVGGETDFPDLDEGTLAVAAVSEHWDELTQDQRSLIEATILSGTVAARWDPATEVTAEVFADGSASGFFLASVIATRQTLPQCGTVRGPCVVGAHTRALIDDTITAIADRLGRRLPVPVLFAFDPDLPYLASATPVNADGTRIAFGTRPEACLITLAPADRFDGPDQPTRENTLAHELFHCFQEQLPGFRALPLWLVEGSAEWVGSDIAGADATTAKRWFGWLTDPGNALFRRAYDNLGFFELMEQAGVDPWSRFDRMLTAAWTDGNQAAYDVAVGDRGTTFAALIATSRVRESTLGEQWDTRGTAVTSDRKVADHEVRPGAPATIGPFDPGVYGSAATLLAATGDVLTLAGSASISAVGFEGAATVTMFDVVAGDWCLRDGGCTCPDGSPGPRPTLEGAPGTIGIAVGTLPMWAGGTMTITATTHDLDDWCAGPPPLPDPCSLFFAEDVAAVNPLPPPSRYVAVASGTNSCEYPIETPDGLVGGPVLTVIDLSAQGTTIDDYFATPWPGWAQHSTTATLGDRSRTMVLPSGSYVNVEAVVPGTTIVVRFGGATSAIFGPGPLQARFEGFLGLVLDRWPAG